MRISLIPHPAKLGPQTSGYNKRIYHLAAELAKRGHDIRVFTRSESEVAGKTVPFQRPDDSGHAFSWEEKMTFFAKAIKQSQDRDIINCQSDHMALPFAEFSAVPVIHTLITSALPEEAVKLLRVYRNRLFSAVSDEVKDKFCFLDFAAVVYNGIDSESFAFGPESGDYFLTLSRIEPGKAVHKAVQAFYGRRERLYLAGQIHDHAYYNSEIKPYLGKNIEYLGAYAPKDFQRKAELIRQARAVLCLTESGEGFSNVVMEALVSGTPVIASARPSFQKIIHNGQNGFIVRTRDDIIKAAAKAGTISRQNCRQTITESYTIGSMADQYEKLFQTYAQKNR